MYCESVLCIYIYSMLSADSSFLLINDSDI